MSTKIKISNLSQEVKDYFSNIAEFQLDSAEVIQLIDSDYIQARQSDKYVASGAVAADTLTLTFNDASTIDIDISDIENTTVNTDVLTFNTSYSETGDESNGSVYWNSDEETLNVVENNTILQVGQEFHIHVRNNTASPIADGTIVMATGTLGTSSRMTIAPYDVNYAIRYIVGVTTETIAAGADGKVCTQGKVRSLDTTGYTSEYNTEYGTSLTTSEGLVLYVSPSTGQLTSIEPTGINKYNAIAFVLTDHANNGVIYVRYTPHNENKFRTTDQALAYGTSVLDLTGDTLTLTKGDSSTESVVFAYLDSAEAISLIDSNYIQARQITYNTSNFVDSAYVTTQINNLIDGAPGTLDTLNEIAAALNDDDSAYATLVNLIGDKDSDFVKSAADQTWIQSQQITYNTSDFADSAFVLANTSSVDSAFVSGKSIALSIALG